LLYAAHTIRNSSTKQFAAIASLQSHHRWCLTGTPIQNSLDDLGSLVRILKLPVLEDPAQFRRHIVNKTSMVRSATTEDFRNLQILLSSICLRRNKLILSLPPDTEYVHCLDFTLRERAEYRRIEHDCIEALDRAVSGHKVKETHQTILETWLRLRLFCNNGNVVRSAPPFMDAEEEMSLLEASGSAACYYCGSELESLGGPTDPSSGLVTACNRAVCGECIFTYKIGDSANCFVCQTQRCPGIGATTRSAEGHLDLVQEYPTKMLALCEDVEKHISQGKK
jgi:SWI/SNF-related matrix-associated actin-dependent regulator of chromatin subfamily A3